MIRKCVNLPRVTQRDLFPMRSPVPDILKQQHLPLRDFSLRNASVVGAVELLHDVGMHCLELIDQLPIHLDLEGAADRKVVRAH